MTVFVSIIMPVYNCELFVARAINSIIAQVRQDWELIIVNDGSTDGSSSILEKFAEEDSRIILFNRSNHGVAASRQYGINHATGKYCIHVDADDWVEPDFIERFAMEAEKSQADIIWSDSFCNESDLWSFESEPTPDALIRAILSQNMWGVLWNKMIKTCVATKWGLVPKEIAMWEDVAYIIPCLLHSKDVTYIPKPLYHYNIENQESMVHKQQNKNMAVEYCLVINHLEKQLLNSSKLEDYQVEITGLKLFAIRDYIDDIRIRDYDKFMKTYPEAIEHIWEYKDYPMRLKISAWLISQKLKFFIPIVLKIDSALRRAGISKQI